MERGGEGREENDEIRDMQMGQDGSTKCKYTEIYTHSDTRF
jgi:hypothetical protein